MFKNYWDTCVDKVPGDPQNEKWERDKNKRDSSSREECDSLQQYACDTEDMSSLPLCWLVTLVCCKCGDKLSKKGEGSSSSVSTIWVTGLNRRHVPAHSSQVYQQRPCPVLSNSYQVSSRVCRHSRYATLCWMWSIYKHFACTLLNVWKTGLVTLESFTTTSLSFQCHCRDTRDYRSINYKRQDVTECEE